MPNKYQLAFLATFASVFSALVLVSRFLNSKLLEAGYDYRNLILLGLPGHEMSFDWAKIQDVLRDTIPNNLHAVDVPYVGTYDLVAISKSPTFIITGAVILATAFLAKVLHTGLLSPSLLNHFISPPTRQVAPNLWIPKYGKNSPSRKKSRFHPIPPCA